MKHQLLSVLLALSLLAAFVWVTCEMFERIYFRPPLTQEKLEKGSYHRFLPETN